MWWFTLFALKYLNYFIFSLHFSNKRGANCILTFLLCDNSIPINFISSPSDYTFVLMFLRCNPIVSYKVAANSIASFGF
jgi:hypothetical protein